MKRAGNSRTVVRNGEPLRVRRVQGREADSIRVPTGEALVAVLELGLTAPVAAVRGREDALVTRLRALESEGPAGARRLLAVLNRRAR